MSAEPTCCGEPMVHNSFMEEYECADAYFALLDDGVLADCGGRELRVDPEDMTPEQRDLHKHWLASFKADAEVREPEGGDPA